MQEPNVSQGNSPSPSDGNSNHTIPFPEVLQREYESLFGDFPREAVGEDNPREALRKIYSRIHNIPHESAALCLSGGGIRSATFGLGVLQGLAAHGLLQKIPYLSTVSGGGYIGGWLSAWLDRRGRDEVMEALKKGSIADPLCPEPEPIRNLRSYSNYLSPRLGLFSADVWTLAATLIRNLILNWMAFIPMLLAFVVIPFIATAVIQNLPSIGCDNPTGYLLCWVLFLSASSFFVLAISYIGRDLPSHGNKQRNERSFLKYHLVPLLLAMVLFTTCWPLLRYQEKMSLPWLGDLTWQKLALYGGFLHMLGWLIGLWRRSGWALLLLASLLAFVSGFFGGGLLFELAQQTVLQTVDHAEVYVVLATPTMLGIILLAGVLLVGLFSFRDKIQDPDREWWSRAGAWIMIASSCWLLFSSIVLLAPKMAHWGISRAMLALGGTSGVSGAMAALIGWSSKSTSLFSKSKESKIFKALEAAGLRLLTPLFAISLISTMAIGVSAILCLGQEGPQIPLHWDMRSLLFFLSPLLLFGIGCGIGYFLSVNRFSLHAMYRNRLIRAYLGASQRRKDRHPHPFTGFDPADNIHLGELIHKDRPGEESWPLHIVNIALNLAAGKELAWQNRKALSFTASKLHCGSSYPEIGYLPSQYYAGKEGLTLGTAITTSGAAASPNMGYHSSRALAFVMALFNARLGCWLPNPGEPGQRGWRKSGPDNPLFLLKEMFGLTNAEDPWVYLSDGGHFENLALYEMIRRRCRFILVSDASADKDYKFEDLANAIHKIRVDQGIQLEYFKPPQIWHKSKPGTKRCALLKIHYEQADGGTFENNGGFLIYIKPGVAGSEPPDLLRYSDYQKDFPHQATSDQFFDEDQFESYRMLGFLSIEEICQHISWNPRDCLSAFFTRVEASYL